MKAPRKFQICIFLGLLLTTILASMGVNSLEVIVGGSPLKDVYYQGEELILRAVVWNNGSSALEILYFNISIWRIEERYGRLRNIERVYYAKFEKNITIEPNQQFSEEIIIKINLQPARYNLSFAVVTKFTAGATTESTNYIVPSHIFWVKPSFEIPILIWAGIIEVILMGLALFIYRRLRR